MTLIFNVLTHNKQFRLILVNVELEQKSNIRILINCIPNKNSYFDHSLYSLFSFVRHMYSTYVPNCCFAGWFPNHRRTLISFNICRFLGVSTVVCQLVVEWLVGHVGGGGIFMCHTTKAVSSHVCLHDKLFRCGSHWWLFRTRWIREKMQRRQRPKTTTTTTKTHTHRPKRTRGNAHAHYQHSAMLIANETNSFCLFSLSISLSCVYRSNHRSIAYSGLSRFRISNLFLRLLHLFSVHIYICPACSLLSPLNK